MRSELGPLLSEGGELTVLSRLNKLLGDVVISQGGVVPHIDPAVRAFPSEWFIR